MLTVRSFTVCRFYQLMLSGKLCHHEASDYKYVCAKYLLSKDRKLMQEFTFNICVMSACQTTKYYFKKSSNFLYMLCQHYIYHKGSTYL